MATAAAAGLAVAMAAYAARFAVVGAERMMMQYGAGGAGVRFAQGGFLAEMTKREASQILAVRQSANADRVKAQHKKLMQINHPDRGGSPLIATKLNEAKDIMLGKKAPKSL